MARTAFDVPSVHRLLEIHDDGDKLAEINTDLEKLLRELTSRAADGKTVKGSLTITIDIEAHAKGADVAVTHATKSPKKPPAKSSYFVNEDGDTLTTRNPRQREMFGARQMDPHGSSSAG